MFFSIIVPIYKVEEYLPKCIESVISQDCTDYELILVDDGSPDNSGKIADNYARNNKRIHVIHKENGGLSDARNAGMKEAKGRYILFLDSDDALVSGSLTELHSMINKHIGCDVYYAKVARQMNGHRTEFRKMNLIPEQEYSGEEALHRELVYNGKYMAMAQCGIYDRCFLAEQNLLFKMGILHEDEQWSPRVELSAQKVMYIDVTFYNYIIRNGSITQSNNKVKNARDLLTTCQELRGVYCTIGNQNLKKLLLNYIAKLYMHSVSVLLRNDIDVQIDRSFFRGAGKTGKDLVRFYGFCISPRLYAYLIDAHFVK